MVWAGLAGDVVDESLRETFDAAVWNEDIRDKSSDWADLVTSTQSGLVVDEKGLEGRSGLGMRLFAGG